MAAILTALLYLGYLSVEMYSFEHDIMKAEIKSNDMLTEEDSDFMMKDYVLMPTIETRLLQGSMSEKNLQDN